VAVITALVNDDIAITTIPGEPFIQHQLNLAEASSVGNTFLLGYAYCGAGSPFLVYVPTAEAVKQGGYGAAEAAFVAAEAGEKIVNDAVKSIHSLAGIAK